MYAPALLTLPYYLHQMPNGCSYDGVNLEAINGLFDVVSSIPAVGDDDLHHFWLSVPRGNAVENNWDETEDGPLDEYYPLETYWFLMSTKVVDGRRFAWLNNELIIAENPEQPITFIDVSDEFRFLAQCVRDAVTKIMAGTYKDWLEHSLPLLYRRGYLPFAKCKKFFGETAYDAIPAASKERFAAYASNPPHVASLKGLTLNRYMEICALGYRTIQNRELSGLSDQQLFERLSDERNGGLTNLPPDDAKAFDEWYAIPDKWIIYNPSHLWEVIQGSSRTRIHLYPQKTEDGYTFVLSGYAPLTYPTLVSFYLALVDAGIPVVLSDIETISKIISGNFNVGIIPIYESASAYLYVPFPAPDVYAFIYSDENDLEQLLSDSDATASITWLPIEGLEQSITTTNGGNES